MLSPIVIYMYFLITFYHNFHDFIFFLIIVIYLLCSDAFLLPPFGYYFLVLPLFIFIVIVLLFSLYFKSKTSEGPNDTAQKLSRGDGPYSIDTLKS
jgi:hypothetical protein